MRLSDDVLGALAARGPLKVLEHCVLPINFACPIWSCSTLQRRVLAVMSTPHDPQP